MTMTLHPFFVVMALAGIFTGLLTVNSVQPSLMPLIMAVSLAGLAIRLWQIHWEGQRSRRACVSIDFEALRAKDFTRYADWLKENVRGHDEAVERVTARVQQGLGLAGGHRLLGAFLLAGPAGTGKTFLAELVGKALYPDSEPLVLDMENYKEEADADLLLGSRGGDEGALTRPVLDNPYRVVVLKRLERCHAEVQRRLHDLLETGRCRDRASGRVAHFNACAVFATSGAGVEAARAALSRHPDGPGRKAALRDAMFSAGFEKSVVARFDEILLLDELPPMRVAEIVALQLAKHWRQYGIEVTYASPEILMEAVRRNNEFREYGVRQLSRLIQDLTDSSLAEARRNGVREVRLGINRATGQITIV